MVLAQKLEQMLPVAHVVDVAEGQLNAIQSSVQGIVAGANADFAIQGGGTNRTCYGFRLSGAGYLLQFRLEPRGHACLNSRASSFVR